MLGLFKKHEELSTQDVAEARKYIKNYWKQLKRFQPVSDESLIKLPHPYLVPASQPGNEYEFDELYYWDSYFMVQGLMDEEHKELVTGILDNLIYEFEKFNVISNASRTYLTGRSQPPFLTSFIWDVYEAYDMSEEWLTSKMNVAIKEYQNVWTNNRKPHHRKVYEGLSRYYDINVLHDLAEAESGWDMTTRFNRRCLNFLPVDLNALLYKYEVDIARYYKLVGKSSTAAEWRLKSMERKRTMNKLMWSRVIGLYYDYNFVRKRRGQINSLAGFYPMWAGMIDKNRAKRLVKALIWFEFKGGLATTDALQRNIKLPGTMPTQWAYPNGWAPLHFLVIEGLEKYGYHEEARRIAMKWLKTNLDWFNNHGVFLEKYNVVNPSKPPAKGVYAMPTGFGWTNSVFEYLCKKYIDNQTKSVK